jgi:hypothetical protein
MIVSTRREGKRFFGVRAATRPSSRDFDCTHAVTSGVSGDSAGPHPSSETRQIARAFAPTECAAIFETQAKTTPKQDNPKTRQSQKHPA